MSTGGETIGVAEVQLRVGGAPGFDRAMAAAGASTVGLGRTIQATSQTSGQAWAKLFAPPPMPTQKGLFGAGPLKDPLTGQLHFGGMGAPPTLGPPVPREPGPWDKMFAPAKAAQSASQGIAGATRATHGLDEAQKQASLSGRATAIVMSRMSASASEVALSMTEATNREAAFRSAIVASTADMAGAIALTGAMTGTVGGLALGMTASLIPALVRTALSLEDVNEKMRSTGQVVGDVTKLIDDMAKRREAGISTKESTEHDTFEQMVEKRKKLLQEMEVQEEKTKRLRGPANQALADTVNLNAPGRWSETFQDVRDAGRAIMSRVPYFGRAVETPDSDYVKRTRYDFQGLFREMGQQISKESGMALRPRAATADEMRMGLPRVISPEAQAEKMGREAYQNYESGGPARFTPEMLFRHLPQEKQVEIRKQLEGDKGEGPQGVVNESTRKLRETQAQLQDLTSKAMLQADESLLKEADPRKYQKMLIERERLWRQKQLKDAGFGPGSAEVGMANEIASRKTEDVDKGQVAGVMSVAGVHDAIQNMLANSDYARRTALNTDKMANSLDQIAKRGTDAAGKPTGTPGHFGR